MATTLAKRMANLEKEVTELKTLMLDRKVRSTEERDDTRLHGLEAVFGIFKDDPEFDEIIRLGAAYRRRQPKC